MKQDYSILDLIIFQPELDARSNKIFDFVIVNNKLEVPKTCYSRIVPERIDDYAWENDKVAFRTYGPLAQKLVEDGKKGGIISSGIDCWLKKVDYPIIDKWYKDDKEKGISYHEDHGEGLDNYHVGSSRGAGGIAYKKNDQYFVSKNFIKHKTISNGPIRTVFSLDYDDWNGPNGKVKEKKIISLDYGNNLSKIQVKIEGLDNISAGISLQENNGEVEDSNKYIIYKQNHYGTTLSNVLLTTEKYFNGFHINNPGIKDNNHVFLDLKVIDNSLEYYTGFYWSESNHFKDHDAWKNHLEELLIKIENPIKVKFI